MPRSRAGAGEFVLWFSGNAEESDELPWSNFAVAHFATHAIVELHYPELSGIVLSTVDAEGNREDGVLWLHEIYRTPMPVSLVLLSGCRTASGKWNSGGRDFRTGAGVFIFGCFRHDRGAVVGGRPGGK